MYMLGNKRKSLRGTPSPRCLVYCDMLPLLGKYNFLAKSDYSSPRGLKILLQLSSASSKHCPGPWGT